MVKIIIYITYLFGLLNLIGNKWQLIPLTSAVNVGLIDNGKKVDPIQCNQCKFLS